MQSYTTYSGYSDIPIMNDSIYKAKCLKLDFSYLQGPSVQSWWPWHWASQSFPNVLPSAHTGRKILIQAQPSGGVSRSDGFDSSTSVVDSVSIVTGSEDSTDLTVESLGVQLNSNINSARCFTFVPLTITELEFQ